MSPLARSARLRRMIADLSAMDAADADAVLSLLESKERDVVTELLREYSAGAESVSAIGSNPSDRYDPTSLSKWLVERLEGAGRFEISPHTDAALRITASRLFPLACAERTQSQDLRANRGAFWGRRSV